MALAGHRDVTRAALLVVVVATTAANLLVPNALPVAVRVGFIVVGTIGAFALAALEEQRPRSARPIIAAILVVMAVAVVAPSRRSKDLYAYTMIGRTVERYGANPYRADPATFARDPMLHFEGAKYRSVLSPYGPSFVALAAATARIAGPRPVAARIAFQAVAGLAVGAALVLLWRRTHDTAALALLGLHPVVALAVVNGGHADALVALALLGATLLALDDRFVGAGAATAAAVLIKATALFPFLALTLWCWRRRGLRAALAFTMPGALVAVPLTMAIPGALSAVRNANAGVISRASVWNAVARSHLFQPLTSQQVALVAVMLVAVACGVLVRAVDRVVVISAAAWVFLGAYFLPWYAVLALPVAARRPNSAATRVLGVQAGVLVCGWEISREILGRDVAVHDIVSFVLPCVMLAAACALLFARDRLDAGGAELTHLRPNVEPLR
jgi:hypothetical protein